jgi:glycosyltransferase A (GT-A) superfamily protein (DUF2064 family)
MAAAFEQTLSDDPATPLLLMGTDAPMLDAAQLGLAAAALRDRPAVFVPALDGGYALVGLRHPVPALFGGMVWSTAQVMAETRTRLAAAGLAHTELPPVADIDVPADLLHLPADWLSALASSPRSRPGRHCGTTWRDARSPQR